MKYDIIIHLGDMSKKEYQVVDGYHDLRHVPTPGGYKKITITTNTNVKTSAFMAITNDIALNGGIVKDVSVVDNDSGAVLFMIVDTPKEGISVTHKQDSDNDTIIIASYIKIEVPKVKEVV